MPLLWAAPAAAQLELGGSTRVRYETIDGQARVGVDEADELVSLRTILSAEYDAAPLTLGAELWDSRIYAADRGTPVTTSEVNALEFVQAYARVDLGSGVRAQAGRFILNLGSRRVVAADDYRNTTSGYTGARLDLTLPRGVEATAIYTLPQRRLPDDRPSLIDNEVAVDREGFGRVLWGGIVTKKRAVGAIAAELSFFHLGERDGRSLDTFGGRLFRDPALRRADGEFELLLQRGTDLSGRPVSAWFVHADAGYSWVRGWRLSAEIDHASGDRGGGRNNRFDTIFGMRRADFGPSGLYAAIGRANILSPGLRIEGEPSRRLDLLLSHRILLLASRTDAFATTGVRDPAGRSGRYAGQQIDARVRWWLMPERIRLEVDGVVLFKGRFLRNAPNAPTARDTRYLSLNAIASF